MVVITSKHGWTGEINPSSNYLWAGKMEEDRMEKVWKKSCNEEKQKKKH